MSMPKFINFKLKYGTEDYWEDLPDMATLWDWIIKICYAHDVRFAFKYVPDYKAFSASLTFLSGNAGEKEPFTFSQMSDDPYRTLAKLWLVLHLYKGLHDIHQAIDDIKAEDAKLDELYREFRRNRK